MFKKSRVLVTGGTGMVARYIKQNLERKHEAIVLAPNRSVLDLENKESVWSFIKKNEFDYVFHLAGKVHGLGGNLMYPLETLSSNIIINDSVLSACVQPSIKKIFFAGTVASYEYPYSSIQLTEDTIFTGEPHTGEYGYAMAKRLAHAYLKLLSEKFEKKVVYGIYTNLYGPHDRFNITSGHVIPSLIAKIATAKRTHQPLNVWGSASTTRDFLFADDAANAAIHLMENSEGVYNIASGHETSMGELVTSLTKASKFNGEILWDESKPIGISRRFSNIDKLNSTGFLINNSLDSGILKTWEWYENAVIHNEKIRT